MLDALPRIPGVDHFEAIMHGRLEMGSPRVDGSSAQFGRIFID